MNTVFSIMLMAYTASLVVHFVVASMAIDTMQKTMARRGSLPAGRTTTASARACAFLRIVHSPRR